MSKSLDYTAKQLVQMLIYLAIKQVTVFMSESLDHTFKQLVQTAVSFRKESSDCIYEGVIESHIQIISLKLWLIRGVNEVFMSESSYIQTFSSKWWKI